MKNETAGIIFMGVVICAGLMLFLRMRKRPSDDLNIKMGAAILCQ